MRFALLALSLLAMCACERAEEPHRADWVIRSRIEFLSGNPAPLNSFRLWVPLTSGDLYGAPTSGSFINVTVNPDYTFEIDLNKGHDALLKSLEKTTFSVSGMRISPPEARIARVSAFVMQADGIDPIGTAEWLDPDTNEKLMLVYFDRPARITGARHDIDVTQESYVWIAQSKTYRVVPHPKRLVLAVSPRE